jgi:hypothetical protein
MALALASALGAQAPKPAPAADAFAPVRFLVGAWQGEGVGVPGQSSGAASFRFELEGKTLIRRSFADSAAGHGRPASHHEDLMTLFEEGGHLKALYLDNEGHIIHYLVAPVPGGVAFTSEPGPGPRFRLSYLQQADGLVTVRFEMAPPAAPEGFKTYLEAATRKVQ